MKKFHLIGNWKMNGSRAKVLEFANNWSSFNSDRVVLAIAPPFPYLEMMAKDIPQLKLAAQDCASIDFGPHTGDVAADMLADLGCTYVILGHSERRASKHEDNLLIAQKVSRAQASGLIVVVCVGESEEARNQGKEYDVVLGQLEESIMYANPEALLIAYEPVWAIGTGNTASPEQASLMHRAIHEALRAKFGDLGEQIPILYGGSVNITNALDLFRAPFIDGALVGGASLDPKSFLTLGSEAKASLAD